MGDWNTQATDPWEFHADVLKHHKHPNHVPGENHDDICLFELVDELFINPGVQPAVLPEKDEEYPRNTNTTFIGWGYRDVQPFVPDILQKKTEFTEDDFTCSTLTRPTSGYDDNMFCTSPGGSCFLDGGGPLMISGTNKVIGVLSWTDNESACPSGFPDVFVQISKYRDFIDGFLNVYNATHPMK